jgi:thymidylate synthase (FAD)
MTAEIILKSTIDVTYVDHMGNDERCVEAMLVSTKGLDAEEASHDKVRGRLSYLIKNRHGTPFECGALTVRVHAPIKVWREWHRHRVGFSYNEESGRYKQLDPVFWLPPRERPMMRPEGFRSAYPDFDVPTEDEYDKISSYLEAGYRATYGWYVDLLAVGADRGLARDVLGVGIFSACYVTMNPRSVMHFLELRTKCPEAKRPSRPLWEIDNAARQLEAIFARLWPITHSLWNEHGRAAP